MSKIKPKEKIIQSTRELIEQKINLKEISILNLKIRIDSEVFNPSTFFSSQWFSENLAEITENKKSFLEIGCGTGIISLYCGKRNPYLNIYSTDINPKASEITKLNSDLNKINNIHVYCGDVFDGIPEGVSVDIIFWAMPFGYLDEFTPLNNNDWQVFDPGYRAIRKFFEGARKYINNNGRILFGFSRDIGHFDLIKEIAYEYNFELKLITETYGIEKDSVSMEIWEAFSCNE